MAITLLHIKTKVEMEFKTPKELKKMLEFCNPTWLKAYQNQISTKYPHIIVEGMGKGIIVRRRQ